MAEGRVKAAAKAVKAAAKAVRAAARAAMAEGRAVRAAAPSLREEKAPRKRTSPQARRATETRDGRDLPGPFRPARLTTISLLCDEGAARFGPSFPLSEANLGQSSSG